MTVMHEKDANSGAPREAGALSAAGDIEIMISGGPVRFRGEQVAHATSRKAEQVQWTELTLYWTEDVRRTRYAVVSSGLSVLYHQPQAACNTGVRQAIASLTDEEWHDLVPCARCRPADLLDMRDAAVIRKEVTLSKIIKAEDAAELVRRMRWMGKRGWTTSVPVLSLVAETLLWQAAERDPDIAQEMRRPRRLGDDEEDEHDDRGWPAQGQAV